MIDQDLPIFEASKPTFATLLIGVNDWVQDVPEEDFVSNLADILDQMQATLPDPGTILLVTIPDFSVTPAGSTYSRGRDISAGIAAFNEVITREGSQRNLPVADIFPLSQTLGDGEFVADDGLHPSAAAYAKWEDVIFPKALDLLTRP